MRKSLIRNIIGGISFTGALFVFQACYGTVQDFEPDCYIEGQVRSKNTSLPIKGIRVIVEESGQYEISNDSGHFSLYTSLADTLTLLFEDVDTDQDGSYVDRDTVISQPGEEIYLDILMESP